MPKLTAPLGLLLSIFLLFLFPSIANAQVVINEFSSHSNPEWVEIYNVGSSTVSLQGHSIFFDDSTSTQKYDFCDNHQIGANAYILITRPTDSYWLADSGDSLILKKGSDIIDSISYGTESLAAPTATQSATRPPDGGASWVITNSPSPNGESISFNCPTPTPTPSPTPIPTPTSTPTKTPTPTPTKTPTPKPSPKEEIVLESQTSGNDQILGLREQLKTLEPEGGEKSPKKKFPILPVILIIFGAGLMGFAGYTLFKKMKAEGYNNQSEENN